MDLNKIIDGVLDKELRERKVGHYYISEMPYCQRAIWYRYKKPRKIDSNTLRIFERGNVLHDWISKILFKSRDVKLLQNEQRLIIPVEKGIFLRGRLDDFIVIEEEGTGKYVLEIKTTANIETQREVSLHHLMQITPYLMIEECSGMVVYIDARYLQIRTFPVSLDWNTWEEIKKRVIDLHNFLVSNQLPSKEAVLKERSWECRNCAYSTECHLNEK